MEQKKTYKGVNCSVVGCNSSYPRDRESVNFYCFSKRNLEQRELWIKAVNRINQDGTKWLPKTHTRVCSKHFVTGKPNPTRTHPDYVPSVFPTRHREAKKQSDVRRQERFMQRRQILAEVFPGAFSKIFFSLNDKVQT
jgi:hypothetical protein